MDPPSDAADVGDYRVMQVANNLGLAPHSLALDWASSAPGVAAPTGDNGGETAAIQCYAAGTATITATLTVGDEYAGQPATGTMTCTLHVAGVFYDTTHNHGKRRTTTQYTATSSTTQGNPVPNAGVTWSASNPAVASVSATGLVSFNSPGVSVITATSTVNSAASYANAAVTLGDGTCSLNPSGNGILRNMAVTVQSDPGGHAAQINFPANFSVVFGFIAGSTTPMSASGISPFLFVNGDFVSTNDCAFELNGRGTIGGQQNVGVRLQGTWSNGAMTLTYTVGTNGELSGGATVFRMTG